MGFEITNLNTPADYMVTIDVYSWEKFRTIYNYKKRELSRFRYHFRNFVDPRISLLTNSTRVPIDS